MFKKVNSNTSQSHFNKHKALKVMFNKHSDIKPEAKTNKEKKEMTLEKK